MGRIYHQITSVRSPKSDTLLAEIKEQVVVLTEEELNELYAFLFILRKKNDVAWQEKIAASVAELEAGKGIPQAEVERFLAEQRSKNG